MTTTSTTIPLKRFGTFAGVFTPSILTIFGVIMYMRAGFVVGQAGVRDALVILGLGKGITLLTGLSISAIATNIQVRSGGAYYLISRTLGPEFGGSIGLALFLAQTLSVPFYIMGFTEAVVMTIPALQPYYTPICLITVAVVAVVTYVGANWAIRAQYIIMAALGLSIAAFLGGAALKFDPAVLRVNWESGFTGTLSFWPLFAVYFPAVTGIMAGVNMSGELKNPTRSLPLGTLCAIGTGALVYGLQIVLMGGAFDRETLVSRPYTVLLDNAILGGFGSFLVAVGVICATLSSAIGSLLGAPRIMYAVGEDRILAPLRFFGKLSRNGEPRRAIVLVTLLSFVVIYFATSSQGSNGLNTIAPIVTMLFLFTYGMVNLAAFVESFGRNPSFRPRFKLFHWILAFAGAVGCGLAAIMIDLGATVVAGLIITGLFMYVRKFVLTTSFGDARRGFIYSRIRDHLFSLAHLPLHSKNWRPTMLVLSGNPASRLSLVRYGVWLSAGRGIVNLVSIIPGDISRSIAQRKAHLQELCDFAKNNRLPAFCDVLVSPDLDTGLSHLFQSMSLPPLKPNIVTLGWSGDPLRAVAYIQALRIAQTLGMSIVVLKDGGLPDPSFRKRRIDIWWRGRKNGSLMVILAYLLSLNNEWRGSTIRILRTVTDEAARTGAIEEMQEMLVAARITMEMKVIHTQRPFFEELRLHSRDATVIFVGFEVPTIIEAESFQATVTRSFIEMPTTMLVYSSGEADLLS